MHKHANEHLQYGFVTLFNTNGKHFQRSITTTLKCRYWLDRIICLVMLFYKIHSTTKKHETLREIIFLRKGL